MYTLNVSPRYEMPLPLPVPLAWVRFSPGITSHAARHCSMHCIITPLLSASNCININCSLPPLLATVTSHIGDLRHRYRYFKSPVRAETNGVTSATSAGSRLSLQRTSEFRVAESGLVPRTTTGTWQRDGEKNSREKRVRSLAWKFTRAVHSASGY